jgi:hypothetical protein
MERSLAKRRVRHINLPCCSSILGLEIHLNPQGRPTTLSRYIRQLHRLCERRDPCTKNQTKDLLRRLVFQCQDKILTPPLVMQCLDYLDTYRHPCYHAMRSILRFVDDAVSEMKNDPADMKQPTTTVLVQL